MRLIALFLSFVPFVALAQEPVATSAPTPAPTVEKYELTPGVIANSGRYQKRAAIDLAGGKEKGLLGEEGSPVQGSVVRVGSEKCAARITNPSEKDTFSVGFAVDTFTSTNKKSGRKTFSATVGPKQTVERLFSCRKGEGMELSITSGKKLK